MKKLTKNPTNSESKGLLATAYSSEEMLDSGSAIESILSHLSAAHGGFPTI